MWTHGTRAVHLHVVHFLERSRGVGSDKPREGEFTIMLVHAEHFLGNPPPKDRPCQKLTFVGVSCVKPSESQTLLSRPTGKMRFLLFCDQRSALHPATSPSQIPCNTGSLPASASGFLWDASHDPECPRDKMTSSENKQGCQDLGDGRLFSQERLDFFHTSPLETFHGQQ